jgi:hypothetical protein
MVVNPGVRIMPHFFEEISAAKEALKHFNYDTLKTTWLVLDLDNTVMESTLELGSDQWFSVLFSHGIKTVSDIELAKAAIFIVYHEVQHHVRTQLVEPKIGVIINALQYLGVRVLGLTARGEPIMKPTLRQLNEIGIDFSKNCLQHDSNPNYSGGIIFCDGGDKGEALTAFLNKVPEAPEHVVMLDDKGKHLEHVSKALEPLDIHFSGLRYGHLDEKVSVFDMQRANAQLASLFERLPTKAREAIERLKLIPEEIAYEKISPTEMAAYFFNVRPSSSSPDPERPSKRFKADQSL